MPVKRVAFVEGKDAALVEQISRAICLSQGGNCTGGRSCGRRDRCEMDGWTDFVDEAELTLRVIRETHTIVEKDSKRQPPRKPKRGRKGMMTK